MAKHTPTPWRFENTPDGSFVRPRTGPILGQLYATGRDSSDWGREIQANGELIVTAVNACSSANPENPIAAAEALPELINALQEAVDLFGHECSVGSVDGAWLMQSQETLARARRTEP